MKKIIGICAGLLILAGLVYVGISTFPESKRNLECYIVFYRGDGLKPEVPIEYKGIQIGKVKDVEVRSDGEVFVKIFIHKKHRSVVRTGSIFELKRRAFGSPDVFISLEKPGDSSNPLIKNGEVVKMPKTFMDKLDDIKEKIKGKIREDE